MADKKAETAAPAKGNKKTIMMAAIGLVLVAGAAGGGYLLGKGSQPPAPPAQAQSAAAVPAGGGQPTAVGPMVNMDSFVINILEEKETRYLKAAITLELDTLPTADEVKLRMPQIRDAILLMVGNKTFNEVRDLQGKLQLRAEMLDKINSLLQAGKVQQIYFTDFVVQ